MATSNESDQLSADEIIARATEQLKVYEGKNLLERVGLFMTKVQLFENNLKNLLVEKSNYERENIDGWALSRVKNELTTVGLRKDYIALLEEFIPYRNHIVHELLANEAMLRELVGDSGRLEERNIERGAFELERLMIIYDFMEENGGAWTETELEAHNDQK